MADIDGVKTPDANLQQHYFTRTRTPWVMFLALLPVIVLVELGFALSPDADAAGVLARIQLQDFLRFFTLAPIVVVHALGALVGLVLIIQHLLEQGSWRVRVWDVPLLWLEGCIAAVPLLVLGAAVLPDTTPLVAGPPWAPVSLFEAVLIGATAALSEELIFRMGGMSLVHWLFVDVCKGKAAHGSVLAVVVTAVAFMLYHDPGAMSAQAASFILLSGLYLGTLFVQRGFACAVLAHCAYDVIALS
ncbi:MAG: CPBP family glutamic-type intramembrane protease [Phycisphaerales bacterium]|nr:CPBP family glutamic-type intramembrane protease [Phycisphaerales bacterium]